MIVLLEPAVAMAPDFLQARVLLAEAYGRMYWTGEDPGNQYVAKARTLVAEINKRWPGRPESVLAQAQLRYNADRNYEATLQGFRAVEAALPGEMNVVSGISSSLKRLGRAKEFLDAASDRLVFWRQVVDHGHGAIRYVETDKLVWITSLDVSQVLVEENMKDASPLASRLRKDAAP